MFRTCLARGLVACEEARIELRLPERGDPERHSGRESFAVAKQPVVSLKRASKMGRISAQPTVPRRWTGRRQASAWHPRPMGIQILWCVLRCKLPARSLTPTNRVAMRSTTHCARHQTTMATRNVVSVDDDDPRTWGVACWLLGGATPEGAALSSEYRARRLALRPVVQGAIQR